MKEAILLFSDGFSISEILRGTEIECQQLMTDKYTAAAADVEPLWLDQSYCGHDEAILYMNGEDVCLWKVICL